MNYIHKLKFTDADEAAQVLTEEIRQRCMTITDQLHPVKPATYDDEGNELTPAIAIEGYHIDILATEAIEELKPYCLDKVPDHPVHGHGWAINEINGVLQPYAFVLKDKITIINP